MALRRHPLFHPLANKLTSPLDCFPLNCIYSARPLANVPPRPRNLDDIERLSRGESTRGKIGNRGVGHRLTQKERILFEAAKRNGFLKIPVTGIRKNVINIYRLWCQASDREFITR